jgi:hypothetical protein
VVHPSSADGVQLVAIRASTVFLFNIGPDTNFFSALRGTHIVSYEEVTAMTEYFQPIPYRKALQEMKKTFKDNIEDINYLLERAVTVMTVQIGANTPIFTMDPAHAQQEREWWRDLRTWPHVGIVIVSIAKHHS